MKRILPAILACLILMMAVSCSRLGNDPADTTERITETATEPETPTQPEVPSQPEQPDDPPAPQKGLKTEGAFEGFGGDNAWDWSK